jgi:uncharacterized protein (TIGR04255 family)
MSVAEKHPNYPNPQIVEALCELHYESKQPWKATIPGELFKRLQHSYPELEPITEHGVIVTIGPDGIPSQELTSPRIRFKLKHGSLPFLIMISEQTVSLNVLSPYPGWPDFKSELSDRWTDILELVAPSAVKRIGLRYINRLNRTALDEKPGYWLKSSDYISNATLESPNSYLSRMEARIDMTSRLLVTLAHDRSEGSGSRFGALILDIDCITEKQMDAAWNVFNKVKGPKLEGLLNKGNGK